MNISVPEPAPIKEGLVVADLLKEKIRSVHSLDNRRIRCAIKLIEARDNFGRKKYGQPLMTKDGRNSIEDALQELIDLMFYIYKAQLNGEDLTEIKFLIPVLLALLR